MTEKEKMEKGLWYDANFDPEILRERLEAEELCFEFNQTSPKDEVKRRAILEQLIGSLGKDVFILSPLYADYGKNSSIGDGTFINHGAYLMDGAKITIGSMCFIGPNCGMYTAAHPLLASERNAGLERAKPITIEDNVWIGADVTILQGVTIGEGSIIGAKSLVTKDIPDHVIAMGNPCRVIRAINESDKVSDEN